MHETAVPSPYYANCAISRAISPRFLGITLNLSMALICC